MVVLPVRFSSPAVVRFRHARQSKEYVARNGDPPKDSDAIAAIWERAFPDAPDRLAKLAWLWSSQDSVDTLERLEERAERRPMFRKATPWGTRKLYEFIAAHQKFDDVQGTWCQS